VARNMANFKRAGRKSQIRPPDDTEAPAIELPAGLGWTWALQHFRGQPVVLVFYPADWEPVSADQLRSYNEALPEVHGLGAELVGVSVDSVWCHRAFARDLRLSFNLLSDFRPRGGVARAYGVYRPRHGTSGRALFVIDALGLIRWRYLAPLEVNPGLDGILTALEDLASKKSST
jgi:peroxiredoxin